MNKLTRRWFWWQHRWQTLQTLHLENFGSENESVFNSLIGLNKFWANKQTVSTALVGFKGMGNGRGEVFCAAFGMREFDCDRFWQSLGTTRAIWLRAMSAEMNQYCMFNCKWVMHTEIVFEMFGTAGEQVFKCLYWSEFAGSVLKSSWILNSFIRVWWSQSLSGIFQKAPPPLKVPTSRHR